DQLQAVILVAVVPTNPLVAYRAFPGRGRKTQQGNPFPPIVGSIPKRLADLANHAEIVMGVQQLLETPLLALPDRANPDLPKLQVPCPARPLRRPSFIARTNPIVQIYRQPSGRPRRLNRGQFTVQRGFTTKTQTVAMTYAQLSGAISLREIEAGLSSHQTRLYHLGVGPVRRSSLADANARRPSALFSDL